MMYLLFEINNYYSYYVNKGGIRQNLSFLALNIKAWEKVKDFGGRALMRKLINLRQNGLQNNPNYTKTQTKPYQGNLILQCKKNVFFD